jgi:hypothetical protein
MDNQYPQITVKHNIGNTIEVPNQINSRAFTYLSANSTTGATSVIVDNATDFTAGSILTLIGTIGNEYSEIVVSASHTDQLIALTSPKMPHNRGDMIQEINFNQIVISKSATIDGVYSVLSTTNFQTTQQNTIIYDATGLDTDYYKVQWKNSITSTLSSLSDPIDVLDYPANSVANVIFPVLKAMGVSENDTKITVPFCLSAIDDARKFTEAKLYGIRHAWQQEFEHPIQLLAGTNYVPLPENIDFSDTDRSVLAARFLIGNVLTPYNLRYIDKRSWNQIAFSVMGGFTTTLAGIGAVSVSLDSAGDFPNTAGGVAYVATTGYTQTIMQISYTSVNLTTNQLLGVTGITRAIPIGTRVWSRPTISQPIYYTVYNDRLYFDRIIPDSMQGTNLYIDYYKKLEVVENLNQVLKEHYRESYKWYLRYAIKYRKDIALGSDDPDLKKFQETIQALFDNLWTGQDTVIVTA